MSLSLYSFRYSELDIHNSVGADDFTLPVSLWVHHLNLVALLHDIFIVLFNVNLWSSEYFAFWNVGDVLI